MWNCLNFYKFLGWKQCGLMSSLLPDDFCSKWSDRTGIFKNYTVYAFQVRSKFNYGGSVRAERLFSLQGFAWKAPDLWFCMLQQIGRDNIQGAHNSFSMMKSFLKNSWRDCSNPPRSSTLITMLYAWKSEIMAFCRSSLLFAMTHFKQVSFE